METKTIFHRIASPLRAIRIPLPFRKRMGWALVLALMACADWNDHYDADTSILDSQQSTIWENIQKNSQLSEFASLLQKAGYDEVLNASQTYTVWAPVNGSFDYATLSSLSSDRLLKEFVQNHIARNNYPASGAVDERLFMLNEKMMFFDGSGSYAIQGVQLTEPNMASRNGTIHLLNGKIPFVQNIYESLNNQEYPLDSISSFFHSYDVKKLNERKSVIGPILNGEITYLDSVFDEHNDLFTRYLAYINREDSNYSMIVPTNEAWRKAKEHVSQYFHYVRSFEFMEDTSPSEKKKVNVNIQDLGYLTDSIVNMMLVRDLFYNNNMYDNKKLNTLQTGQTLQCDSLYGTRMSKVYSEDAALLFSNTNRVDKSNGCIWITDSMMVRPWTTWNPEIVVQAEQSYYVASLLNVAGDPQRYYVADGTQNPAVPGHVSGNTYVEIQPISSSTNPGIVFYLPSIRSTTYSIYMVMVPANILSDVYEAKPNRISVSLGYADASGKNVDSDRSWADQTAFVTDSSKVDTLYLGDFTFPMAYFGTGSYYPYLRVNSAVSSSQRKMFDRTLRIDCVILRPKELDNYLKEHPDYKYDNGVY